jgi:hypothetical protein
MKHRRIDIAFIDVGKVGNVVVWIYYVVAGADAGTNSIAIVRSVLASATCGGGDRCSMGAPARQAD